MNIRHIPITLPFVNAAIGNRGFGVLHAHQIVHTRQQVHVLIARDARSIIPPVAELEEALCVERPLGRFAQETFPINSLWACIGRHGVAPCADCARPENGAFHHEDLADLTRFQPRFALLCRLHAEALAAHLDEPSSLA